MMLKEIKRVTDICQLPYSSINPEYLRGQKEAYEYSRKLITDFRAEVIAMRDENRRLVSEGKNNMVKQTSQTNWIILDKIIKMIDGEAPCTD
jgi:hypothetical protein